MGTPETGAVPDEERQFTKGDRVLVTDPGLAELRAIFKRFEGYEKPNHHGTVEEVWDDRILIYFDDGGSAPYPPAEVRHLGATDD